jgi:hypothetical protein
VLRGIVSCAHCVDKTTWASGSTASGAVDGRWRSGPDWWAQVLKTWEWSFFRSFVLRSVAATGLWDWNAVECGYLSSSLPTTTMRTFHLWRGSTRRRMQKPTPRERFLVGWRNPKVVALELVLPPTTPGGEKKSRVFTPLERFLHCLNICMVMRRGSHCKQRHRCSPSFSHLWVVPTISHCTPQWFPCNEICAVLIIMEVRIVELFFLGQHIFWVPLLAIVTLLEMLCLMAPRHKSTLEINRGARGRLIPAGVWLTYFAITFLRTILVMVLQLVIGGKQWSKSLQHHIGTIVG